MCRNQDNRGAQHGVADAVDSRRGSPVQFRETSVALSQQSVRPRV